LLLRKKLRLKRQKLLEETKDQEKNESDCEDEHHYDYPEECKVLDIMKEKYYDAVQFFRDTDDSKQLKIAV
jgi:hypothetical protein